MQPNNNQRPVMDVTAPSRPSTTDAPAVAPEHSRSLPVHEPPASTEATASTSAPAAAKPEDASSASPAPHPVEAAPVPHTDKKPQAPTPSEPPAAKAPVGAIVGAVFGMLLLSILAIMIYLQS